jgi:hypothetical protein
MTRAHPSPLSPVLLLAALAVPLAACGAAPMVAAPAGAKAAEAAPAQAGVAASPPKTVDEALAELDRAEGDVTRALGVGRRFAEAPGRAGPSAHGEEDKRKERPVPAAPQPASPPPPSATAGGDRAPRDHADEDDHGNAVTLSQASPCVTACRALASMERAVEHLCGLAGASDSRCESARTRARTAAERVRSGCPACPAE